MRYATKIRKLFDGNSQQFIIPLYQRTYAWKIDNCRRLFEDLLKIHRNNLPNHFFGSIVTVNADEISDDLLVIDGQQRITTISLLLLAVVNAIKNKDLVCEKNSLIDEITETYLIAKYKESERNIKLCPIERDKSAYDKIFDNKNNEFISNSGITQNYNFFYDKVIHSNLTAEEFFTSIEKLVIIDLRLEREDNPQLIFESLNSTGKDLTEADKIRNYLLMSLTKKEQEDYYNRYWIKIEECTNDEPTMFFRDYLTVYTRKICKLDELYFEFKSFCESKPIKKEDLLTDLLKYALYYSEVSKGETKNEKINKKLKQLASIGSNVGMPFYMSFFDYVNTNSISVNEVWNVLDVIENFWARRIICSYNANVMSKLFSTLHNEIIKIIDNHNKRNVPLSSSYSDLLKYIILKKQGIATFPVDEEVGEYFKTKKIYRMNTDYKNFLFERLENGNSNEGVIPVVEKMQEGKITIEHIMPQTLTQQWKQDLGENWQEIYNTYLDTFANLTLTGYNPNYSNRPFIDKLNGFTDKDGQPVEGLKESHYTLNDYIKKCNKWTLVELQERQRILFDKFLHLWPMIDSQYTPLSKDTEEVSLIEEFDFTGYSICSFSYRELNYEVSSWKDMVIQLLQILYRSNTDQMIYLASKNYWLHSVQNNFRINIGDSCYIDLSNSTKTKISILHYVFENLNIPESDLTFHLITNR